MRHVLILAALAAALVGGCAKLEQGPQTTAIGPEIRPLSDLKPAQPPKSTDPTGRRMTVTDRSATADPNKTTPKRKKPSTKPPTTTKKPPAPAGTKMYTIQMGDNGYYAIARKLYGDQRRWKDIEALNPGVDTTKLKLGQKIRVPVK
jgi:nucleoid-associated protein YgaU